MHDGLDVALFRALNHTVDTPAEVWLWTALSSVGNAAPALAIGGALLGRHRRGLVAIALAFVFGGASVQVLKFFVDAARPLAELGPDAIVSGPRLLGHSFPSGHAATAASLALLWWLDSGRARGWLAAALGAALLVAVARVAVGVHWPVDVFAGFVLGLATASAAWWLSDRLRGWQETALALIGIAGCLAGTVVTLIAREPDLRPLAFEWRLIALALIGLAVVRWRETAGAPLVVASRLRRPRPRDRRRWLRLVRPVLGLALIVALAATLDTRGLWTALSHASLGWFVLAVAFAVGNNVVSALRWQTIAVRNGFALSQRTALKLYFEGVAANSVLPGGIVGGDLWRTVGLLRADGDASTASAGLRAADTRPVSGPGSAQAAGPVSATARAAAWPRGAQASRVQQVADQASARRRSDARFVAAGTTVLVDRIGGVWGLCLLSLLAAGVAYATGSGTNPGIADGTVVPAAVAAGLDAGCVAARAACTIWPGTLRLYALLLAIGVLVPVAFMLGLSRWLPRTLAARLRPQGSVTVETLPLSLVVQVCSAGTLWCCLAAVRHPVPIEWVCFLAAAIFIAAIVPAAIGGFGAREAAAVAVFGTVGITPELAFAASVLFGLTATVQGLVGMALWFRDDAPGPTGRR